MIIIVNGAPGIGKTTIAHKLSKKLKKAIVIEVDKIKYFAVDSLKSTDSLDIADHQLFMMIRALRSDKDCIILGHVYDSPKYFQAIVRQLKPHDRKLFAFKLRSTLGENVKRDHRRPKNLRLGDHVNDLARRLDEQGDAVGYTVETTGLSVEKTADKIHHLIEAEIGRF